MAEQKFRKGDQVRFELDRRYVYGVVKEDRGPIGIKGRRLYLIEFPFGSEPNARIELPAAEIELVEDKVAVK